MFLSRYYAPRAFVPRYFPRPATDAPPDGPSPLSRTWRASDRGTRYEGAARRTTYTPVRDTGWSARPRRTTWIAEDR